MTRAYINLWDWFDQSERQAQLKGDTLRLKLPEMYRQGWRYVEAVRHDEAKAEFANAAVLAHQLGEDWWELFLEFWVCEVCLLQRNYIEALDRCAKMVTKMQRPHLKEHPYHAVIYYTLARTYYLIDALGYEAEIYQALATIESDIPLDLETHQRMFYMRAALPFENEDWDTAYSRLLEYLERVEGNDFRQRSGYTLKAEIHFARGELYEALVASQLREVVSRNSRMFKGIFYALMWQGILYRLLGKDTLAEMTVQRALRQFDSLKISVDTDSGYCSLLADYHEVCGNLDAALIMRDKHLLTVLDNGSLDSIFYAYLYRCYLLNRMGKPLGDDLAQLEHNAKQHRKPDFFLRKVDEVQQGRIARFDWQIERWQVK